uniref:Cyclin-dependent kinase inhibitor domain-containing protein n=1 Tax=Erpetoichthys calabaricus TaxID=27687 RepID=A0A8C4SMN0_ERPCA
MQRSFRTKFYARGSFATNLCCNCTIDAYSGNIDIMDLKKGILLSSSNRKVCRNLFGPVDRDQLHAEYQEILQKVTQDSALKWGFDFVNETPLEGSNYQWERVPSGKVPALYRSCFVTASIQGIRLGKENEPVALEQTGKPFSCQNQESTPKKCSSGVLKRKQTNITDFYQSKKMFVQRTEKA